jgi:AraC-like DNA-binding protein
MSKTRQARSAPRKAEPPIRCMSVSFPTGGKLNELVSGWDRLVYASRGHIRVTTPLGEWVVPPHRALWVPAGVKHRVEIKPGVSLRALYFRPPLSRRLPRECRVMNVSGLLRELILHVTNRAGVDPYLASDSHAVALLLDQLRDIEVVPLQLPLPRDARALRAARLLTTGDGTRRSLEAVGRSAGASPRTLQRLFLAETGLTFEKWRQRARLARAVELLSEGRKVTSVAFEVGYDSPSAFVAMFRRELGATPRRYLLLKSSGA